MMFASRKPAAADRWIGSLPALQMAQLLRRLRRDRSGSVAMLFSLLLIPLVAMIGLAVDFGRVDLPGFFGPRLA
jgi:putative copper export protein